METTKQAARPRGDREPGPRGPRVRPWQRALALLLVALMATAPVSARGPGRAGIADLAEEPDLLPPPGTKKTANFVVSLDPVTSLPGNPTLPGLTVDTLGQVPLTVSLDAIRGAPDTMTFGDPFIADNGEMMVPLLNVKSNVKVNGKAGLVAVSAHIGKIDLVPPLKSLKATPIPPVLGLEDYVLDRTAAIALGKALFWDSNVGADGQACASCHFSAGADSRRKNQLNPGNPGGDHAFNPTFTGGGGANYTLKDADFPFYRLKDALDRNSTIDFQSNDVAGSQGTFGGEFMGLGGNGKENCAKRALDEFSVHGALTRRVTGRNAPTVINAVFNFRNFWDGRANNTFNGVNPFGDRDPNAKVLHIEPDGTTKWVRMSMANASLASQAVGPALSDFEMSCSHETFQYLGRKMIPLKGLATQKVHPQDSVLGGLRDASGSGLTMTYEQMIKAAFMPEWWAASGKFDGFTQMENNFSMFWGLAIMLYESTLVSDEAPIDRFIGWAGSPPDVKALSQQELRGLLLFRGGKALCSSCHKGAEYTSAATGLQPNLGETNVVEQMFVGGGQLAMYDSGFYNIGVRPTVEDVGVGGGDPFGNPLSFSREYLAQLNGKPAPDPVQVNPCLFAIKSHGRDCWVAPDPGMTRVGVDGSFKTPTLRNVALTAPYFHNGSRGTLEQVVEFYNRGGDRRGPDGNDSTGLASASAPDGGTSNVHPSIRPLGLTQQEKDDLVAFLRNALTDRRVACQKAPFDHPSLRVPSGHAGDTKTVTTTTKGGVIAVDEYLNLAESGAKGVVAGLCLKTDAGTPLPP